MEYSSFLHWIFVYNALARSARVVRQSAQTGLTNFQMVRRLTRPNFAHNKEVRGSWISKRNGGKYWRTKRKSTTGMNFPCVHFKVQPEDEDKYEELVQRDLVDLELLFRNATMDAIAEVEWADTDEANADMLNAEDGKVNTEGPVSKADAILFWIDEGNLERAAQIYFAKFKDDDKYPSVRRFEGIHDFKPLIDYAMGFAAEDWQYQ